MKRLLFAIAMLVGLCLPAMAQNTLNNSADNIVGTYSGKQGDDRFRARVVKLANGTYRAQVVWLEHDRDAKGNKILDTKIYDPQRGIRAKLTAWFTADGRLALKGSLFGISETVYWTKLPPAPAQ